MKKILFTDFFDTLIYASPIYSKEYYNSRENELDIVCRCINDFLRDGNYMVVVTAPGVHDSFAKIFNKTLVSMYNRIDESLRSNIFYYFQGNCTRGRYEGDKIVEKYIDGKKHYFGNHEVHGIHVDRKENAIKDFLQNVQMPYQIYAIGDNLRDITMLLKAQELGGYSSFIDTSLYKLNPTTDEIIKNQLNVEFQFPIRKVIKNMTMEEKMQDNLSPEMMNLLQKKEERRKELYELLYTGKLKLDELDKNYHNFVECDKYDSTDSFNGEKLSEDALKSVIHMPCYSCFTDYYTKVLKKR